MDWKLVLLLALLLIVYLTAGAYLFHHLEGRGTLEEEGGARQGDVSVGTPGLPENFTQALRARYPSLSEDELPGLVEMVVAAYTDGTLPSNSTPSIPSGITWDVSTSFFFVGTVVTTIGYGNVAPTTAGGRVATIFYGLVGIPLCLIFLAGLGEKLLWCFQKLESLCGHMCHRCEKTCHVIRVLIMISIGWVLFLLIPALIFSHLEGWDYLDAVYFCFVTLSTIGFGDLVTTSQGADNMALYRVLTVMWVYVGLAWLSSLIALIADILQKTIDKRGSQIQGQISHGVHHLARHVSAKVHHHDLGQHGADNRPKYMPHAETPGEDPVKNRPRAETTGEDPVKKGPWAETTGVNPVRTEPEDTYSQTHHIDKLETQPHIEGTISVL